MVDGYQLLTIFAKRAILDVWQDSDHACNHYIIIIVIIITFFLSWCISNKC